MAVSSDDEGDTSRPLSPPPRTDGVIIQAKMPTFNIIDGVFMIISMLTFVVDIATGESLMSLPNLNIKRRTKMQCR